MLKSRLVSFKVVVWLEFLKRSLLIKGFTILIGYRLITIHLALMLDSVNALNLAKR